MLLDDYITKNPKTGGEIVQANMTLVLLMTSNEFVIAEIGFVIQMRLEWKQTYSTSPSWTY